MYCLPHSESVLIYKNRAKPPGEPSRQYRPFLLATGHGPSLHPHRHTSISIQTLCCLFLRVHQELRPGHYGTLPLTTVDDFSATFRMVLIPSVASL
jgi:hypothetical protein